MALSTGATTVVDAVKERLAPAFDIVDETMRQGRQVIARGRNVAEDAAGAAVQQIRRRPLKATMMAAGAAACAGVLLGFACGWFTRGGKR